MDLSLCSEVNHLASLEILKYRGQKLVIPGKEGYVLSAIAGTTKGKGPRRIFILVPETSDQLVRSVVCDLAYLAVEKKYDRVFIATDIPGALIVENVLLDHNTGPTDLKRLLLKFQREKLRIVTGGPPAGATERSLTFYFRAPLVAMLSPVPGRRVALLTLRDALSHGEPVEEVLGALVEAGWTALDAAATDRHVHEKDVSIMEVPTGETSTFTDPFSGLGQGKGGLGDVVSQVLAFYLSLPVPLSWYSGLGTVKEGGRGDVFSFDLPSRAVALDRRLPVADKLVLQAACQETESRLLHHNPKYSCLQQAVTTQAFPGGDAGTGIVVPSKGLADAMTWGTGGYADKAGSGLNECPVLFPESVFYASLLHEVQFGCLLFTFCPPAEVVLAAHGIADTLAFCIYPDERPVLDSVLAGAARYGEGSCYQYGTPRLSLYVSVTGGTAGSIGGMCPETPARQGKHEGYHGPTTPGKGLSISVYNQFISQLSSEDHDWTSAIPGRSDNNTYVFTTSAGEKITVKGWESVVLLRTGDHIDGPLYQWVPPRAVSRGDRIIVIPSELKMKYLREEFEADLSANKGDVDALVRYIAQWKAALVETGLRTSFSEIWRRLGENGVHKSYLTVRKWFDGLYEDPVVSAITALLDPGINIGPEHESDIRAFGKTFGFPGLVDDSDKIFAAMRVFRSRHMHLGKGSMLKILGQLEREDVRSACTTTRVKAVSVRSPAGGKR